MPAGHHCPNCRELVKPDWNLCSNCGYQKLATPGQIRCRVCGRSAAGILWTCPHCGAYLEPKPLPLFQLSLGAIVLIGLTFGLVRLRQPLSDGAERLALLVNPPTSTVTATATATVTATFAPTPTPSPSSTATPTTVPTATVTPTPTPTPTPEPTEIPISVPIATNTHTPTPTPTARYGQPILLEPEDGKIFGRDGEVILRWENMGSLAPNEWYAVRLRWSQNGEPAFGGHNLKDDFWLVPADQYWGLADQFTGREYEWFVFIEEITTDENGQQVGKPISEISERSSFMWQE